MSEENNNIDLEKIYAKLLPTIKNMYGKFNYIGLSEDEFVALANKLICEIYVKYGKDILKDNCSFIKRRVEAYINKHINTLLNDEKSCKLIVDNFIKKYIKTSDDYRTNFNSLKKLCNFFRSANYDPEPELYFNIIDSNSDVNDILKSIVDKNIDIIKKGNIDVISSDTIFTLFLSAYCSLNSINYEEDIDDDFNDLDSDFICTDIVKAYMQEAGKYKLLTREEEQILGKRIAEGDKEAEEEFIKHNLRLVISIAKKYIGHGLSFLDLIQEGNLGLMRAISKFDYTLGIKFSTFAIWWIKQSITRGIADKSRLIRIPVHNFERMLKIKKYIRDYNEKYGTDPEIEVIAKDLKLNKNTIKELMITSYEPASLDNVITEDNNPLIDFIADEKNFVDDVVKAVTDSETLKIVREFNLSEKELQVLFLRNGIGLSEPMTLEQIAGIYGVSRERIRQIESKALRKIRCSRNITKLSSFVDNEEMAMNNIKIMRQEYYDNPNSYRLPTNLNNNANESKNSIEKTEIESNPEVMPSIYTSCKAVNWSKIIKENKNNSSKNSKVSLTKKAMIIKMAKKNNEKAKSEVTICTPHQEHRMPLDINGQAVSLEVESNKKDNNKLYKEAPDEFSKKAHDPCTGSEPVRRINKVSISKAGMALLLAKNKNLLNSQELVESRVNNQIDSDNTTSAVEAKSNIDKKGEEHMTDKNKLNDKSIKDASMSSTKSKRKSLTYIYEYFNEYTEEEVNIMLDSLPKCDRELINYRYGNDFKNPSIMPFKNKSDNDHFYGSILPRMKNILKWNRKDNNKVIKTTQSNCSDIKDVCDASAEKNTIANLPQQKSSIKVNSKQMSKSDYINVLEVLKSSNFGKMLEILTPKEAVVICLKFGYVNSKYFTTEAISQFLGIDKSEINTIVVKALSLYKDNINIYIDKAIDAATKNQLDDKPIVLEKNKD